MKDAERILNTPNQGKDYWLAVPLNDSKTQDVNELEFYILSNRNTVVTLEVPGTGFTKSKKVQANQLALFTTKDGTASWDWEATVSEVLENRGIHIYADEPIVVYMRSSKVGSSDGYLALPTTSLGTDYIHCGYYDNNSDKQWRSGFIAVATEDNTSLSVSLNGRGGNFAKTSSGSKIKENLSVTLSKGDIYTVRGDGTTIGTFDLTGTKIHADKPIAVISYHERTSIPQGTQGGDFICEMLPPTSS